MRKVRLAGSPHIFEGYPISVDLMRDVSALLADSGGGAVVS